MAKYHRTLINEFKEFILRGNVIDLAVGVIIGGAFNKIVTSLVNDIVMPVFSAFLGQHTLASRFLALDGQIYESIEAAGTAPLLKYGSFFATVLDFLLMGLVIFALVKTLNFLHTKILKEKEKDASGVAAEASAAPTTKTCPYCISTIHIDAVVCPQCTHSLADAKTGMKADMKTDMETDAKTDKAAGATE